MNGIQRITAERRRQRAASGERYSLSHDRAHTRGELARAAAVYAMPPEYRHERGFGGLWPFAWAFKPSPADRIRELEKAGALIAAEIDRLHDGA